MKKLTLLFLLGFLLLGQRAWATPDTQFKAVVKINNGVIAIPSSVLLLQNGIQYNLYNGVPATQVLVTINVVTPNVVSFKTACATASIVLTNVAYISPTRTLTSTITPTPTATATRTPTPTRTP
jgi:hypothetical protein